MTDRPGALGALPLRKRLPRLLNECYSIAVRVECIALPCDTPHQRDLPQPPKRQVTLINGYFLPVLILQREDATGAELALLGGGVRDGLKQRVDDRTSRLLLVRLRASLGLPAIDQVIAVAR